MRNQWRLLLLRSIRASTVQTPTTNLLQSQKVSRNLSYLSPFLNNRNVHINVHEPTFNFSSIRTFSSEPDSEQPKEVDYTLLTNILSKSSNNDEIKTGLESIDLGITHDMVLATLKHLKDEPEIAWRFFSFVSETENQRLSSRAYNSALGILGRKGYVDRFWGLVEVMKKKGFGIHEGTNGRVTKSFEKDGMMEDLGKFKEVYGRKESSIENVSSRVCKLIRKQEWDEEVQKKLRDLGVSWSNELVAMVIGRLGPDPLKALMFFWWVEEDPSFKHDKVSYNAMLKVLGREDSVEKFWRIVDEMKGAGYEMDMETYVLVIGRFYDRRMVKDAVDLYEFMMGSETKPNVSDSIFLLRKIVTSKDFGIDLFSRALKIYADAGNSLTRSNLDSLVKALISVERLQESGKILKSMQEYGFIPTNEDYNKIIYLLGSAGKSDESSRIIDGMEASGLNLDYTTYSSLIHGQCVAHELEKASSSFQTMVEKFGVADAALACNILVDGFCYKKRAEDAYKFLSKMVDNTELRPFHNTYKTLIVKLLSRGSLTEALGLLRLMKHNNYPPYLNPFIRHISKSGTGTDAMRFLSAVSDKKYPSTTVFIQMFEAFFKAGRHSEAQNCLSECPSYIRSHADVLNLFCAQKSKDADVSAVAA